MHSEVLAIQEWSVFLLFWEIMQALSPSATLVCGRFWEKPLPSDCFMTACVFSCMCPSSHVLSLLLGELTQTHKCALKHTDAHTLADQCKLFLCRSPAQINSLEARQGVWLGQRWTHAGIRAAVCDSHLSLNLSFFFFFQSHFLLLSFYTPSLFSLLSLPPMSWVF